MLNRRSFFAAAAATTAAVTLTGATAAVAGGVKGHFEGRSNHVTSGAVKIVEEGGRYIVELGDDFSLDGGPDPRVALGKDGKYDPDTKLGALLSLTGKQRYAVPATWDISKHNEVYIWCEVAGVPLGVAKIK
ncbi:twin-arginine translocation pathway signal protein [Leisingera sp. ANG-M1]|uniref:DM13 domain-containing protein n=1 Tax=unclassified Leisingera TaxID=2614906 RepID=UPI000580462E|nr:MULTISPECIES: DM13 domain-containing protein [unclassified Leisingera]KIC10237.1 twin-arginine translocation pathway signal protein [Leisingera sp. ANG-M1]KIC20528.1 twin-arginine translocation pathway signal protein [Leisingera sp. ANG-Vp]